jgi:biotin carboxylase
VRTRNSRAAVPKSAVRFIGPPSSSRPCLLAKGRGRAVAMDRGIPVVAGTDGPTSLDEARDFGGRGLRVVARSEDLEHAFGHRRGRATPESPSSSSASGGALPIRGAYLVRRK